jgi:hypothetical protein
MGVECSTHYLQTAEWPAFEFRQTRQKVSFFDFSILPVANRVYTKIEAGVWGQFPQSFISGKLDFALTFQYI